MTENPAYDKAGNIEDQLTPNLLYASAEETTQDADSSHNTSEAHSSPVSDGGDYYSYIDPRGSET